MGTLPKKNQQDAASGVGVGLMFPFHQSGGGTIFGNQAQPFGIGQTVGLFS